VRGPEIITRNQRMKVNMDREGLPFNAERNMSYNSRRAQELSKWAEEKGKGDEIHDALFRAYFEQARDIGDPAVLAEIAARCEVSGWPGAADEKRVAALEASMRGLGISAVPTFIFERRLGVSGAHPPESLAAAMREALT